MALNFNHKTNDISSSGTAVTINGVSVGGSSVTSAATYTYNEAGQVISSVETVNSLERNTTYTYNPDGTLATSTSTYAGATHTETYTYSAGVLIGMTALET